ncbi:hypothetical protein D1816_12385 [Aquimarina sp. AD10]|nr:hypothetical protein D1816_12385 [Aquimarina sp. AD10]
MLKIPKTKLNAIKTQFKSLLEGISLSNNILYAVVIKPTIPPPITDNITIHKSDNDSNNINTKANR